ncbi:hypothetical protein ACHAQJ_005241 [Trichoderma viride]
MWSKSAFGLLAMAGGVASLSAASVQSTPQVANTTVIPNAYIIELQPDFHPSLQPRQRFAQTPVGSGASYEIRHEYNNSAHFSGVSVSFNKHVDLDSVRKANGVKNAWHVTLVPRPEPYFIRKGNPKVHVKDSSNTTLPNFRGSGSVNQPLITTNVQKLHDEGIRGKGIKIALIDSGVDYQHPSLGGGFGPGHKISFGYDLVGDDYTGDNSPVPDPDPLATCADGGHGTHTSGIIGMEDPKDEGFGLVGVAPDAELGMYRVFGCDGGATNDVLVAAMLQAVQDGADVISMSLGLFTIWEANNPFDPLVTQFAQSGVATIMAIGNFGTAGLFSTESPGISVDGLGIGSVENEVYPTQYKAHDDKHRSVDYVSVFPFAQTERQDIFVLGTGLGIPINDTVASGCYEPAWDAAANASVDWNSTILLVSYTNDCGEAWYSAPDLGISTVLVYLTSEDQLIILDEPGTIPEVLWLNYNSSKAILENIASLPSGKTYGLTFDGRKTDVSPANPLGKFMDDFSSFGPTVEMTLQPKISAPGGTILATWPLDAGAYAILSGTSMSTPIVAGSYALLKSQFPHLTVAQLFDRLKTTSSPLGEYNSTIPFVSTARQGAGMLNAYAAVKADSTVTPSEFSLRDSAKPAPQKITITNNSKSPKQYTISHDPAAFLRFSDNYLAGQPNFDSIDIYTPHSVPASAQFSATKLTIQPGKSAIVTVQITPQAEKYPYSQPVYSGFVKISSNDYTYSIPYIGVPYSRAAVGPIAQNISDTIPYASPQILSISGDQLSLFSAQATTPNIQTYHWNANTSEAVVPLLRIDVPMPTKYIRYELVPANTSFVPDIYGFDPSVKIDYQDTPQPILPGFLGVPTYGMIANYTLENNPYPSTFFSFVLDFPTLINGNKTYNITSGDYRPLARALKWNGNETNPDDYESYLGPVIRADIPEGLFPTS